MGARACTALLTKLSSTEVRHAKDPSPTQTHASRLNDLSALCDTVVKLMSAKCPCYSGINKKKQLVFSFLGLGEV